MGTARDQSRLGDDFETRVAEYSLALAACTQACLRCIDVSSAANVPVILSDAEDACAQCAVRCFATQVLLVRTSDPAELIDALEDSALDSGVCALACASAVAISSSHAAAVAVCRRCADLGVELSEIILDSM